MPEDTKMCFSYSAGAAMDSGSNELTIEFLLIGIIRQDSVADRLKSISRFVGAECSLEVIWDRLKKEFSNNASPGVCSGITSLSFELRAMLNQLEDFLEYRLNLRTTTPLHLLFGILKFAPESLAAQVLGETGVTLAAVKEVVLVEAIRDQPRPLSRVSRWVA